MWIPADADTTDDEWRRRFAQMRAAGVDAVLPEVFNGREAHFRSEHLPVKSDWLGRLLPLAKAEGLEVHAWCWCMPCNVPEVREEHPDWFMVNGKGKSAATEPAYVDYYRFLCPSRAPVQEFVRRRFEELAEYEGLDGIHLDYIRFPDVILAEGLQPNYNIVQDREYPEYDYCYCQVCRDEFKKQSGVDPLELEDPSASTEWREFRYGRIVRLVNEVLLPVIHGKNKLATAAVFPNWQHVRQAWHRFKLDAFLPMLYHGFYNQNLDWVRAETAKAVTAVGQASQIHSGVFLPHLTPDELETVIRAAVDAGAKGTSIFSSQAMTEAHWERLAQLTGRSGRP